MERNTKYFKSTQKIINHLKVININPQIKKK